jgi:hypothetical protein
MWTSETPVYAPHVDKEVALGQRAVDACQIIIVYPNIIIINNINPSII